MKSFDPRVPLSSSNAGSTSKQYPPGTAIPPETPLSPSLMTQLPSVSVVPSQVLASKVYHSQQHLSTFYLRFARVSIVESFA
jgi:hypothetical protein